MSAKLNDFQSRLSRCAARCQDQAQESLGGKSDSAATAKAQVRQALLRSSVPHSCTHSTWLSLHGITGRLHLQIAAAWPRHACMSVLRASGAARTQSWPAWCGLNVSTWVQGQMSACVTRCIKEYHGQMPKLRQEVVGGLEQISRQ